MLLVIGDKRLSSWSLRPWLVMKHFGIPFEEKLIRLDQPDTTDEILKFSPTAKVPLLVDERISIWESLAICEYLNEKYPEKQMWPRAPHFRAQARAISSEMHAGFATLRKLLPHDLKKNLTNFDSSPAQADIQRIFEIWSQALSLSGGPFLYGSFSIADAMYAPVVNRFVNYGVKVPANLTGYITTIRNLPAHKEWIEAGLKEN